MSRFFLDHGTRVEVSGTTFLVSKCLEIGAEVSHGVLMPKRLVAEVSGNPIERPRFLKIFYSPEELVAETFGPHSSFSMFDHFFTVGLL